MAGMMDEFIGALVLAGSERAAQARYDRAAFALEKRGYAARLKTIVDVFCLSQPNIRAALCEVIAELEGEE